MPNSSRFIEKFKDAKFRDIVPPAALLLVSFGMCFFAWNQYERSILAEQQTRLELTGEIFKEKISTNVGKVLSAVDNLHQRIEITQGFYFDFWPYDAELIISQNPSFEFIEWIDKRMAIRRVVPLEGNEAAIGLNIGELTYRNADWIRATSDNRINFTHWLELVQGENAFIIDVPVYLQNKLQGTITAGVNFDDALDQLHEEIPDFHCHLYDQHDSLFYCSNRKEESMIEKDEDFFFTSEINVIDNGEDTWRMEVYPTPSFFDVNTHIAGRIGLVLALILSMVMSYTLFLAIGNYRRRLQMQVANEELKGLNENLVKERARAQAASAAKTEFLSNMSHEIRTPLNGILGIINFFKSDPKLNDEQRHHVSLLDATSQNLYGLLHNMLEIERIEADRMEMHIEPFRPIDKLNQLVQNFQSDAEARGLNLKLNVLNGTPYVVEGDGGKFAQILNNLVANAIKFTDQGEVLITYSQRRYSDRLHLSIKVQDTGIGIPKDKLNLAFERFSQVDRGFDRKYEGSGIGLSISKSLATFLGGDIEVESEMGKGSTFAVQLSFQIAEDQGSETDGLIPNAKSDFSEASVLVVEDNELNIRVIKKLLTSMNLKVEVARHGKEAVQIIQEREFNLILMDIHMPIMDGMEATKAIKAMGVSTPIVAVSANVTKEAMRAAEEIGMVDYVTKPFSKKRITALIERYCTLNPAD